MLFSLGTPLSSILSFLPIRSSIVLFLVTLLTWIPKSTSLTIPSSSSSNTTLRHGSSPLFLNTNSTTRSSLHNRTSLLTAKSIYLKRFKLDRHINTPNKFVPWPGLIVGSILGFILLTVFLLNLHAAWYASKLTSGQTNHSKWQKQRKEG